MGKKFNLADYLPEADKVSDSDHAEITRIFIEDLRDNPRNFYQVGSLEEDLADSIQINGLLDPLVVYKIDRKPSPEWRVISGHRRLRAIRTLHDRSEAGRKQWSTVPCRVIPRPADEAREDLMLIQANSTGRVLTPGEMAQQARRLREALTKLREQGADLPGRMRDAVAEAMQISGSKLERITTIDKSLAVPGFRAAWNAKELPEAAAYEIARMSREDQYRLLDRAIDAGLDYGSLDIKSVNKLKRQIEAGESTSQDLAVAAEKLGIKCPEGDYSPLMAYLVAEAVPSGVKIMVRDAENKAEGIAVLHDFGLTHSSTGGMDVCHAADPGGLTITRPIRRRLKWTEVWELIALDTMQRASAWLPEKEKAAAKTQREDAGGASPAPTGEPETPRAAEGAGPYGWRNCLKDPPEEGALVFVSSRAVYWADVCSYRGGIFLDGYGDPRTIDDCDYWAPAPAWTGGEG